MAERYDLKVMRKGKDGKEYGTKIGVAFPWKSGKGFNLTFEALPVGRIRDDGTYSVDVLMAEPYDDQKGGGRVAGSNNTPIDLDDEVPF